MEEPVCLKKGQFFSLVFSFDEETGVYIEKTDTDNYISVYAENPTGVSFEGKDNTDDKTKTFDGSACFRIKGYTVDSEGGEGTEASEEKKSDPEEQKPVDGDDEKEGIEKWDPVDDDDDGKTEDEPDGNVDEPEKWEPLDDHDEDVPEENDRHDNKEKNKKRDGKDEDDGGGSSGGRGVIGLGGMSTGSTAPLPSYSEFWFADAAGNWKIRRRTQEIIKNAWICDDAVLSNGKEVWYLIGADGIMLSSGLVRDEKGNYFSIEKNHNGYYGMMRYQDGYYNCDGENILILFVHEHNGKFGAIKNREAIEKLNAKYGVVVFSGSGLTNVYTSSF